MGRLIRLLHHVIFEEVLRWHWHVISLRWSNVSWRTGVAFFVFDWSADGLYDIDRYATMEIGFLGFRLSVLEGIDND